LRALAAPNHDPQTVYQTCTNSITDDDLRNRLNLVTNDIVVAARIYKQTATTKQLYSIPQNNAHNDDIVVGAVTKKELKEVYNSHMVGSTKPARVIYDQLLSLAPLGKCPFCGFGYASTLDHYLPKTNYPLLSVLPLNLVPACKDCNTGKNTAIASKSEEQFLHPYFDHQGFVNDPWLYAKVEQTSPASISFYVQPPDDWDKVSKERVRHHFNGFKLAARYSVEACNQLACLRDTLIQYRELLGVKKVRQHLNIEALSYAKQHINSWQTAMFKALSANDWYCGGGFN